MKINQCPFCGSRETHVIKSAFTPDWSVECLTCDAFGPSQDGANVAVKSWNEGSPRWKQFFEQQELLEQCRTALASILCAGEHRETRRLCSDALVKLNTELNKEKHN
jgi:hypothetical protein